MLYHYQGHRLNRDKHRNANEFLFIHIWFILTPIKPFLGSCCRLIDIGVTKLAMIMFSPAIIFLHITGPIVSTKRGGCQGTSSITGHIRAFAPFYIFNFSLAQVHILLIKSTFKETSFWALIFDNHHFLRSDGRKFREHNIKFLSHGVLLTPTVPRMRLQL